VYREGGLWFAHCLELDIVAEGGTPAAAVKNTLELCAYQIETAVANGDLESIFRPAPSKFWSLFFSKTRKSRVPQSPATKRLHNFEARELVMA
jgi:hypothetical protein